MFITDDDKDTDVEETWEPQEGEENEFVDLIDGGADPEPDPAPDPEESEATEHDAVQKRIDAITRQRGEADRRAEAAEAELGELRTRMETLESGIGQRNATDFDEKYEDVKARLTVATEEGDTETQVELLEKMTDMRSAKRLYEMAQRQRQQKPEPQEQRQPQEQDAPKAAYDWWGRNQWFNTAKNAAESAYARALDVQLEQEGLDKNTQEYYNELDSRLQKSFPHLYTNSEGLVKAAPAKPPTIGSQGNRGGGKPPKDGRIRLTKEELSMAKEFGLETEDQLREYEAQIIKTGSRS